MPPPRRVSEKAPKGTFKQSMGKLLLYCKKYWIWLVISLIFGVFGIVVQIVMPDMLKRFTIIITDGLDSGFTDFAEITKLCVIVLCLILISAIFTFFQQYISTVTTERVSRKFRGDISRKINKMPLNYFDTHLHGDLLSIVTNDINVIGQSLNESIGTLFGSSLLLIGVLVMMFATDAILSLTVIVATIIGFSFSLIFLKKSQKYFNQNQQHLGELNAHIEEIYSGHNVVRLFNAEKQTGESFDKINKKLYTSGWKSQFISSIMGPIMGFVGNLGYVAVCIVGALLASQRGVSYIGIIVAFMVYARTFSRPLSSIAQALTNLQSTAAASYRVFNFLDSKELPDESDKKRQLKKVSGDVTFEHVSFGYLPGKTIIKDFSAEIKAGQKVAIVGPTGAGKTTLVNLLMRFYEVNSGDIKIDGISIKDMSRQELHSLFGMVLQDTWLFEGTIKENLIYNSKRISDKKLRDVCKSMGVDHFIKTQPNGYNTLVDDALQLSAGQKQLLTIVRTVLSNCPMVILDEATSSVDTRTEILLQNAMDKAMEGRTSFVIAHRLSTIKNADIILVLKDGDIVEQGNHMELLAKNGFYAELYNSQFEED